MPANRVNIIPYLRGHLSRDILGRLWQMIEEAGDWDKIFWNEREESTPVSTRGDLIEWMDYVKNAVLLIGVVEGEISGFMWWKPYQSGHECGIWMTPKYRKTYSRELVTKSLDFVREQYGWKFIYGVTPHAVVRNLALRCGFELAATIRGIYYLTIDMEKR